MENREEGGGGEGAGNMSQTGEVGGDESEARTKPEGGGKGVPGRADWAISGTLGTVTLQCYTVNSFIVSVSVTVTAKLHEGQRGRGQS